MFPNLVKRSNRQAAALDTLLISSSTARTALHRAVKQVAGCVNLAGAIGDWRQMELSTQNGGVTVAMPDTGFYRHPFFTARHYDVVTPITVVPGTDRSKDLLRRLYSKDVYRQWIGLAFPAPAVAGMEDHEVWSNPQRKGFLEAAKTGVRGGYPGHDTPATAELGTRTPWLTMATRMVVDGWTPTQAMEELDQIARDVYSKYFK